MKIVQGYTEVELFFSPLKKFHEVITCIITVFRCLACLFRDYAAGLCVTVAWGWGNNLYLCKIQLSSVLIWESVQWVLSKLGLTLNISGLRLQLFKGLVTSLSHPWLNRCMLTSFLKFITLFHQILVSQNPIESLITDMHFIGFLASSSSCIHKMHDINFARYLDCERSSGWLESPEGLLFVSAISTTCAEAIFRVKTLKLASALDWLFQSRYVTPGFKPFSYLLGMA